MSESDWWLCPKCHSLNSLSARRCYSCRAKKAKHAARASQVLGYRVIESWDGKVSMEQLAIEEVSADVGTADQHPSSVLPPIRHPVLRPTIAVAPRPPNPARITYRPTVVQPAVQPAARVPGTLPTPQGVAAMAPVPPMPPSPFQSPPTPVPPPPAHTWRAASERPPPPVPPGQPPPPGPLSEAAKWRPAPPMPPGPDTPPPVQPPGAASEPPRPLVPVGPGQPSAGPPPAADSQPPAVESQERDWPHWHDLLDGPVPDAGRLREAYDEAAAPHDDEPVTTQTRRMSLNRAISSAKAERSGPMPAWPEADRPDPTSSDAFPQATDADGSNAEPSSHQPPSG